MLKRSAICTDDQPRRQYSWRMTHGRTKNCSQLLSRTFIGFHLPLQDLGQVVLEGLARSGGSVSAALAGVPQGSVWFHERLELLPGEPWQEWTLEHDQANGLPVGILRFLAVGWRRERAHPDAPRHSVGHV